MRTGALRFTFVVSLTGLLWWALEPGRAAAGDGRKWYKGNLHTHTSHSDGDSTPMEVASWYKANRYHFLALTDHNYFTEIEGLNLVHAAKERFLLITGEEVTDAFDKKPVHVNGIGVSRLVDPTGGRSMVETIQGNVNAIRAAGGLPSVNHPNFGWAFGSKELLKVEGANLFEVYNGHHGVNNAGGGGWESLDELWDALLTAGKRWNGIAVDDAHTFKVMGRSYANPGRGWVMVRAARLDAAELMAAIRAGDFYASTGVELDSVETAGGALRVQVKTAGSLKYRIHFIGQGGRILKSESDAKGEYRLAAGDTYVRARVEASNGDTGWTQPVWRQ
jgi:hypothetical protein